MATNYDKYINSTGTHYISNSGHDEHGQYHGGTAGDQTGGEWQLRSWYNRPWTHVLRHPDPVVRRMLAEYGIDAALNNLIGYDQYQRNTYWNQLQNYDYQPAKIKTAAEADCTAGVTANVKAIGHVLGIPRLERIEKDTTSRNMKARFAAADFAVLTDAKYLKGYDYLLPGDILLYENHHAATNITKGKYAKDTAGTPVVTPAKTTTEVVLKYGMTGSAVKEMQTKLIKLGYDLGKWGADGDFGDCTELAVKAFQKKAGVDVDGECGPITQAALDKAIAALNNTKPTGNKVRIEGGNCYIRSKANTSGEILGVALKGSTYPYKGETASNGWLSIDYNGKTAWVSGVYGKLVS